MKQKTNRVAHFLVALFLGLLSAGSVTASDIHIIPQPQSVRAGIGIFSLPLNSMFKTNLKGKDAQEFAAYLKASPFALQRGSGKKASVSFTLTKTTDGSSSAEGYLLTIMPTGITVSAHTTNGLFYGFQTLLQLGEAKDNGTFCFPVVTVKDSPRFSYRGLHLDVSRHFFSKEFVKKQLDAMARYKMNQFHWHLTDGPGWRIEIKRYPELTEQAAYRPYPDWTAFWKGGRKYCTKDAPGAQGGYYTQDDIKEVVDYARRLHITVIPEIEMPGHSEEVLAVYPQLSCSGKPYTNSEFCIGKEETFTFLENVLSEVMQLFPSKYIHIGGDEASKDSWKKCPLCQNRMKAEGLKNEEELQSYLVRRIERFLSSHGRHLLGWDEILEGGIAPAATVMSWRGEDGGVAAAKSGHDAIMTPGSYCYLDNSQDAPINEPEGIGGYLPIAKVYSYNPLPVALNTAEAKHILGVQGNLWTEHIPTADHAEHMIYPRLLALAEVGWTQPSQKDYDNFRERALLENEWLMNYGYHPFDLSKEIGNRPESLKPVHHTGMYRQVIYHTPYAKQYTAGGDSALVDGWRGGWSNNDGRWQGFLNTDVDVVVDLGERTEISSIAADYIQITGPYIWLPKDVTYSVSDDGDNFVDLETIQTTVPTTQTKLAFQNYKWEGSTTARYVRMHAMSNGIKGSWIFTDEIIIQ